MNELLEAYTEYRDSLDEAVERGDSVTAIKPRVTSTMTAKEIADFRAILNMRAARHA